MSKVNLNNYFNEEELEKLQKGGVGEDYYRELIRKYGIGPHIKELLLEEKFPGIGDIKKGDTKIMEDKAYFKKKFRELKNLQIPVESKNGIWSYLSTYIYNLKEHNIINGDDFSILEKKIEQKEKKFHDNNGGNNFKTLKK